MNGLGSVFKRRIKLVALVLSALLAGCGGGGDSAGGSPPASAGFFDKPFAGEFTLGALFDHDVPFVFVDANGYTIDHNGLRRSVGTPGAYLDGHAGYDFLLPMDTPVRAVAAGQVRTAGDVEHRCPVFPGSPIVTGKLVQIEHLAPTGGRYLSSFGHLNTIAVSVGDSVATGQQIGTSGNTGCSGAPHLHFEVFRLVTRPNGTQEWVSVDPYGWNAATTDPWSEHPEGTSSVMLWKTGQAPTLVLQ